MRRVRITADGRPHTLRVWDAETGAEIYVTKVEMLYSMEETKVVLYLSPHSVSLDVTVDAEMRRG